MRKTILFVIHPVLLSLFVLVGGLACGVEPTVQCETYVECQSYFDDTRNRDETEVSRYLPDGICWESTDQADECSAECDTLTFDLYEKLIESEDDPGACGLLQ